MKSYLKSEVEKSVKLGEIECFTADQIRSFTTESYNEINKSIDNDSREKQINEVALEVKSFSPIEVTDDVTLMKSILFIREAQIAWNEPVGDDIQKSRTGRYLNTELNRKLGRVGKEYLGEIEKSFDIDIEKGKKANIGEIREYGGVKYRKVSSTGNPNKDWQRVQESGKTKSDKDFEFQVNGIKESHSKYTDEDYKKHYGISKEESKNNIKQNYPKVYEAIWGGEESKEVGDKITEDDIKEISVHSLTPEYGGGMAYTVRLKDGSKHSIRMTTLDLAKVGGSGVYHDSVDERITQKQMIVNKINEGYDPVKLITDEDMDFSKDKEKLSKLEKQYENLKEVHKDNLMTRLSELAVDIRNFIGIGDNVNVNITDSSIGIGKNITWSPIALIQIKENFKFDENNPKSEFSFREIRLKSFDLSDVKDNDFTDLLVLEKMAGIMRDPDKLEKLKNLAINTVYERSKVMNNPTYKKARQVYAEIEGIKENMSIKSSNKFVADKMKELKSSEGMDIRGMENMKSYGFGFWSGDRLKIVGETPMKYKVVRGFVDPSNNKLVWNDMDWAVDSAPKTKVEEFLRSRFEIEKTKEKLNKMEI